MAKWKYQLMFPTDFAGTLCARDGIKTGPHTPNGEDAYDRKLVVMRMKRKKRRFFSNHQSTSDIQEVDIAPCMGASRNLGPSNNNPLVVTKRTASASPLPFIGSSQKTAIAVLDRCGNNWKNGKGGCGPLLHKEYAPTMATMFQPFCITHKRRKLRTHMC